MMVAQKENGEGEFEDNIEEKTINEEYKIWKKKCTFFI